MCSGGKVTAITSKIYVMEHNAFRRNFFSAVSYRKTLIAIMPAMYCFLVTSLMSKVEDFLNSLIIGIQKDWVCGILTDSMTNILYSKCIA